MTEKLSMPPNKWHFHLILFLRKASRSNVKKKLEVNGFNLARCNDVYSLAGRSLINKQICAGGLEGKDSCSGDSGKYHT